MFVRRVLGELGQKGKKIRLWEISIPDSFLNFTNISQKKNQNFVIIPFVFQFIRLKKIFELYFWREGHSKLFSD